MEQDEQSYAQRENVWDEQWPSNGEGHVGAETDVVDELSPFPDTVGTSDPLESARDAEPYTPAVDPPVLPGGREGIDVATGFGVSPEEEAYQDVTPRGDEDLLEQVVLLLRQDSITSTFNLNVAVRNGVVTLRGIIPSIDEAEHAQAVVSQLSGVLDVVDETTLEPTGA